MSEWEGKEKDQVCVEEAKYDEVEIKSCLNKAGVIDYYLECSRMQYIFNAMQW